MAANPAGNDTTAGDGNTTGNIADNTADKPAGNTAPAQPPTEGQGNQAPPCPTAPTLSQEHYDALRKEADALLPLLPAGSYYTIMEPARPGGAYQLSFALRGPGCPPNCQHCKDEIAEKGTPPLFADKK